MVGTTLAYNSDRGGGTPSGRAFNQRVHSWLNPQPLGVLHLSIQGTYTPSTFNEGGGVKIVKWNISLTTVRGRELGGGGGHGEFFDFRRHSPAI